jgi:hypothetical protein
MSHTYFPDYAEKKNCRRLMDAVPAAGTNGCERPKHLRGVRLCKNINSVHSQRHT